LRLETASINTQHPANTECPTFKGSGEVPQHGGLRKKSCPRRSRGQGARYCRLRAAAELPRTLGWVGQGCPEFSQSVHGCVAGYSTLLIVYEFSTMVRHSPGELRWRKPALGAAPCTPHGGGGGALHFFPRVDPIDSVLAPGHGQLGSGSPEPWPQPRRWTPATAASANPGGEVVGHGRSLARGSGETHVRGSDCKPQRLSCS
jgi:hypothetical protein